MENANSKIFTEGLSFFDPTPNQQGFLRGKIVVEPKKFVEWMQAHKEHLANGRDREGNTTKVLRIDVLLSKQSGKPFCALDTWQPSFQPNEGSQ